MIPYLNISASSPAALKEPTYKWSQERDAFDTTAVRQQLGAVANRSSLSCEDRQVLQISSDDMATIFSSIRGKPLNVSRFLTVEYGNLCQAFYFDSWLYDMLHPPGDFTFVADRYMTIQASDTLLSLIFKETVEET